MQNDDTVISPEKAVEGSKGDTRRHHEPWVQAESKYHLRPPVVDRLTSMVSTYRMSPTGAAEESDYEPARCMRPAIF